MRHHEKYDSMRKKVCRGCILGFPFLVETFTFAVAVVT